MKLRTKWGALATAAILATTLAPTAALADVAASSVNITGLEKGDTVTAYQVFDADVDASNQVTYTAASGLPEAYDTIDELSALTTDAQKKAAADAYAAAFSAGTATGVKTAVTGTAGEDGKAALSLDSGYWVVVVTSTSGKTKVYQATTIDATPVVKDGAYAAATLSDTTPKSEPVDITKTVQDKTTQQYGESTDTWTVGDLVPFKVNTNVPSYPANSKDATFTIGDTPAAGLEVQTSTIKVTVGGQTVYENGAATDATAFKADGITTSISGYTFNFTKEFVLAHPGQAVEVTYQAKLTSAVDAVAGTTSNTATITFNPNPYSDSTVTPDDTTNEKTYGYDFKKVDSKSAALQGAVFTLYQDGKEVKDADGNAVTATSDANGWVTFKGLGAGTYTAKETTVPAGKQKCADVEFTVSATDSTKDGRATDNVTETNFSNGQDVTDADRGLLPSTGEAGTMALTVGGVGLLAVGVAVLVHSRKNSEQA